MTCEEHNSDSDVDVYRRLWAALSIGQGIATPPPPVSLSGRRHSLPSVYDVSGFASASVAVASAAVAEWLALREGQPTPRVEVDRQHAAVAFQSERHLRSLDAPLPEVWDRVAGDYEAADGFIRLHTNYAWHQRAALSVLGVAAERAAVAAAVARWEADALETAIVAAGGCAATMHTPDAFAHHPHGQYVRSLPLCRSVTHAANRPHPLPPPVVGRPLSGVRVLDLTRVIAGPVCTRFLAAFGAEVLRVDPPGFEEVDVLLREVTMGKRRTFLDLHAPMDRARFEALVCGADVLVHGYRPGALSGLSYDEDSLRALRPGLVIAQLSAYGDGGPWCGRRGFDSLVQMSCGIAARAMQHARAQRPQPLPAQALDHGTGYLLAAACVRALCQRARGGGSASVQLSLAQTAAFLMSLGETGDPTARPPGEAEVAPYLRTDASAFGRLQHVACPGHIDGVVPGWQLSAGPLGTDAPVWS